MKTPKIYKHFANGQVFTIDEAREKLESTGNTLRKRLSELAARDYIQPIRQGLYRICPLGQPREMMLSSPFAVAAKIAPYCYLGYRTALQLHIQNLPPANDTLYIVSPTKFNAFDFEGRHYFWCQTVDDYGIESKTLVDNGVPFQVNVSDVEKTLVDCLKRPAYAPQFSNFVEMCLQLPSIPNAAKILEYAKNCDVAALYNRMGLFFELMDSHWNFGSEFYQHIQLQMSRKQIEWSVTDHEMQEWQMSDALKQGAERWRIHLANQPNAAVPTPSIIIPSNSSLN